MEINARVGETAGKVWQRLSENGPLSLASLKKQVDGRNEDVEFAVGWLAREDKVILTQERRTIWVQLRS